MWKRGRLASQVRTFPCFVSGVVIDDEVNVEIWRHAGVQIAQKSKELLVAVTRLALGEHGAGGNVESRKQRGGAMANVVVGHTFHISQAHRQHRLGAVQGLNLALLIDTEDQSMVGRVEIQANNIADLFDEERIGREFEAAAAMRLQGEGLKQPMHVDLECRWTWRLPARSSGCRQWAFRDRVRLSRAAIRSSSILRGRPGRNSS